LPIEYRYNPLDLEPDKAIGIRLPFNAAAAGKGYNTSYTSVTNGGSIFPLSYTTEEQAVSNFKNLLLTRKGERVYHPTFGTDLQNILFENINDDEEFTTRVEDSLRSDINFWLPYITILELTANVLPYRNISDVTNGVNIFIRFRVGQNGANRQIEIQFDVNSLNLIG